MAEAAPATSDSDILQFAHQQQHLLLTEDKDFGELVFRWQRAIPGVVLLRIDPAMRALKMQRLNLAIERLGAGLFGRYTTIDAARLRSRSLRLR